MIIDHVSELLQALAPGSVVIGEESVAANPERLNDIAGEDVWLVDPLDGTNNFVRGSPDFATMVVRLRRGTTVAAWVYATGVPTAPACRARGCW